MHGMFSFLSFDMLNGEPLYVAQPRIDQAGTMSFHYLMLLNLLCQ